MQPTHHCNLFYLLSQPSLNCIRYVVIPVSPSLSVPSLHPELRSTASHGGASMSELAFSFRDANQELVTSFVRYLESQGKRKPTIRKYKDSSQRLIDGWVQEARWRRRAAILVFFRRASLIEGSGKFRTASRRGTAQLLPIHQSSWNYSA